MIDLLIEPIDGGCIPALVITTQEGQQLGILDLQAEQVSNRLYGVKASIDEVSNHDVLTFGNLLANLKHLQYIIELTVDIACHKNWCPHWLNIGLLKQQLFNFSAELFDLRFRKRLALLLELLEPFINVHQNVIKQEIILLSCLVQKGRQTFFLWLFLFNRSQLYFEYLINSLQLMETNQQIPIVFLVEHMEEYLYNWCLFQYEQMLIYLESTNIFLCFTNAKSFLQYDGKDSQQNKSNILQLREAFKKYQNRGVILAETYADLFDKDKELVLPGIGKFALGEICLLDMRGKSDLSSNDRHMLKVFVFGGILGDHPPRDRTKALRQHTEVLRRLGQLQLSTDTAILTAKLILQNNLSLQKIPFVHEPEIVGPNKKNQRTVIQMQGFRYINKSKIDYKTGQVNEAHKGKSQLYMNEGVRKLLLEEQLDVAMFM